MTPRIAVPLAIALAIAGCAPKGPRCFAEGAAPPRRVEPGGTLVDISPTQRSPRACPRSQPVDGTPCDLPTVSASDGAGTPVEAWDDCLYATPRGPCELDACTCRRPAPGEAPVYSCAPVQF
jgi:hypothetical protein